MPLFVFYSFRLMKNQKSFSNLAIVPIEKDLKIYKV